MKKYLKYLEEKKIVRSKKETEKNKEFNELQTFFQFTLLQVLEEHENEYNIFNFKNKRVRNDEEETEYIFDVYKNISYEQLDENGKNIVVKNHVYTLNIKKSIYSDEINIILNNENGARPAETNLIFVYADKNNLENSLSDVFIFMDEHLSR